jgi:hypothetical protein
MKESALGTISGTFLKPGVSANGRYYSKELIAKATQRISAQIADETMPPVSQYTTHDSDDVLLTTGKLTSVGLNEDGSAWFKSDIPDTTAGRDMKTLIKDGYVKNVSILGQFLGDTRTEEIDGKQAETADDMEVMRLDYVFSPGVAGARIESFEFAEAAVLGGFRESFEIKEDDNQYTDPDGDGDHDFLICPECGAKIPLDQAHGNPDAGSESNKETDMAETEAIAKAVAEAVRQVLREEAPKEVEVSQEPEIVVDPNAEPDPKVEVKPEESQEAKIAELVELAVARREEALKATLRQEIREVGSPRRGFVKLGEEEVDFGSLNKEQKDQVWSEYANQTIHPEKQV